MKDPKRILSAALAALAWVAAVIAIFACSMEAVAMNMSFYKKEYAKLSVAETIGADDETLYEITENMLLYMRGKREDLDMVADVGMKGGEAEVFTQLEKEHMVDVVMLIRMGYIVRDICAAVFAAALLLAFFIKRDGFPRRAAKTYLWSAGGFFAFVGAMTLIVSRDFNSAFIKFHEMFFTNDKWWLDPNEHVLINLVPEQFFVDTATLMVVIFMAAILLLAGLATLIVVMTKKKMKGAEIAGDEEYSYSDDYEPEPKPEFEPEPMPEPKPERKSEPKPKREKRQGGTRDKAKEAASDNDTADEFEDALAEEPSDAPDEKLSVTITTKEKRSTVRMITLPSGSSSDRDYLSDDLGSDDR